jgi:PAS domain S-box-containing protein
MSVQTVALNLAVESLQHTEAVLKEAQRIAHIGNWELDLTSNQLAWSDEIYRIFEIERGEFGASYETFLSFVHPDDRAAVDRAYVDSVKNRNPYDIMHRLTMKDGRIKFVHERCETFYDKDGRALCSIGTVQDITERRQAELALATANRALRTLSACNEALVRATSEPELLEAICRLVVETGGYRMAWVGYAEHDPEKTVRPVAQHGYDEGYLAGARISWADSERGRGPTGTAIRTAAAQVNQNFLTNPALGPWRKAALSQGYQSSIALPLAGTSGVFGALSIYAPEPDRFKADEVLLLRELADDLAFGIDKLHTAAERDRIANVHRHDEEMLRQSLENSIKAIANTVEARDRYTAGHQRRVAQLAVAIARELRSPEQTIRSIELAASIHDLGKLNVPAEILTKPGKLSDIELLLVKFHAQAGYEILKGIKFPWPIATIIWQHHERLDGSARRIAPTGLHWAPRRPWKKSSAVAARPMTRPPWTPVRRSSRKSGSSSPIDQAGGFLTLSLRGAASPYAIYTRRLLS